GLGGHVFETAADAAYEVVMRLDVRLVARRGVAAVRHLAHEPRVAQRVQSVVDRSTRGAREATVYLRRYLVGRRVTLGAAEVFEHGKALRRQPKLRLAQTRFKFNSCFILHCLFRLSL